MLAPAAVLVCALDLLGRSQPLAPVRFLSSPPPGASRNAEALLARDPDTIYLITSTEWFRAARDERRQDRREACQKIASVIVHEEWHLRHGPDERSAYQAQLSTLAWLGADSRLITSVRLSMAAALNSPRHKKPDTILADR